MKFSRLAPFFLCLLIAFGLGCRFYNIAWDGFAQYHPDERFCIDVTAKIRPGLPFFDSSAAPLNPLNVPGVRYVYGQLPLFLLKPLTLLFPGVEARIPGRILSAIFDCLTVFFTFLIARRFLSLNWSLFAASLISLSAIHVQHAHFFVTDPFAATFSVASFWALLRFHDRFQTLDATLCGAFWGLAMACKISSFLLAPILLLGFLMAAKRHKENTKSSQLLFAFFLCFFAAILSFRLGNPMAFRGEGWLGFFDLRPEMRYVDEVKYQLAITRGEIDIPFNIQWIGTPKWIFPFKQLGNWAYSWGVWLSGLAGFFWLFKTKKRDCALVLAALGVVIFFGVQGAQFSKFTRYYLPMTPFIALLAAFFWREMALKKPIFKWGALGVALWAFGWCWAVAGVWSKPHTLTASSKWIVENIPPKTVVTNETPWDLGLPIVWIPTGNGDLEGLSLNSYDVDTPEKREAIVQTLSRAQWIFQSSGRSWQNIPRWPQKYPMTTEFYASLFEGKFGFERFKEFTNYPRLGPFEFPDDGAEEALSVYDHPRVILWKKRADFNAQKVRAILESVPLPPQKAWVPREAN